MDVELLGKAAEISLLREYPLFGMPIKAGFPSPAEDWVEGKIDFNQYLVKNPAATYLLKVKGDSMIDAGISPEDIIVVDSSLEAKHKDIVIACINGDMTLKRLYKRGKRLALLPENPKYEAIEIAGDAEFSIWGVVKHVIKSMA